jgi:septal ring factor EnvC (AmiA/AmiB activator)
LAEGTQFKPLVETEISAGPSSVKQNVNMVENMTTTEEDSAEDIEQMMRALEERIKKVDGRLAKPKAQLEELKKLKKPVNNSIKAACGETLTCRKCGQTKSSSEFKSLRSRNKVLATCQACQRPLQVVGGKRQRELREA